MPFANMSVQVTEIISREGAARSKIADSANPSPCGARAPFISQLPTDTHLWHCHDIVFSLSREEFTMPRFIVFCLKVARPGLSALRMLGDFLFSITDTSEASSVSSEYIG